MDNSRIMNYPHALKRASFSALALGMPPIELFRYPCAYTKNAREQLGSREKFDIRKIQKFKTKLGNVFF